MTKLEKLNIVGKRSGDGFVAHKATLVNALARALAERVILLDFTIGRKGFLTYLKAIAGSNVVKIVPANGSASETQAIGKRLKVICGSNTSHLEDLAWVGDKTPLTLCEVRVSPNNTVKPNIGSLELSEALNRVLPFTATEDNRPVLQCVLFKAGEGKLTLVSAVGFRLAIQSIDFDGEGQALINRDDLWGVANALRKARRVNLSFEASGESLDGMSLVIDTEAIRYKWRGADGTFPDYEKLIPTEAKTVSHFDTVEAVKAVSSLKALADNKSYPIDLTLENGMVILSSPDDKGQAVIPADIEGEAIKVRLDGKYLADALRACGGMVDFKLADSKSPTLFTTDGYRLVVMPMLTSTTEKPKTEPEAEVAEAIAEAKAEPEPAENKPRRKRKAKEPVAV
ncbi:MAG TPA: DNA polymerase III subunit beta [Dehalococcoidia bacterium]|nr:DNA polymerase III subunit beta [Dehalococcoidia bacterium]